MAGQPNILWIVTTQWRGQATGYAGDPNARTPWLDGLASEAINYAQAVTPHPLGPQARAALLTGKLCPENGVSDYWDPLPIYQPDKDARTQSGLLRQGFEAQGDRVPPLGRTVAHALRDRGYATAFFGKWHLAERDRRAPFVGEAQAKMIVPPERRGGFELWEGFESGYLLNDPWLHGTRLPAPRHFKGYQAEVLVQRAAEWCRSGFMPNTSGINPDLQRPYFCVVSLEAPHPPYHAPAPHVAERKPAEIKLPANVPLGGEIEKKAREELAGYYAHIEATDRAIGQLIAEVDLSETAVVFTSVHGDMHGSHGVFRKAWPYEESIRVPLLIRREQGALRQAQGLATGSEEPNNKDNSPVSLVDLPHMAVAWAEGREWHCKRDSAAISMPTAAAIPLQCPRAWRGFRTPKHKLVLAKEMGPSPGFPLRQGYGGQAGQTETVWLYFDLERDPLEMKNLAGDPARAREIEELKRLM